jgi:hypothetical protein
MNAKEFVIQKFESNNLELLKSIHEWEEFSIKQNYEGVHIILNQNNIPNCPAESEYGIINDRGEHGNLFHYHLRKITAGVVEYFTALGYSEIHTLYPKTEISPNNTFQNGFLIIAKL